MTKSLLLEIGLEELPAQYVRTSSEQLATRVEEFFKQENNVKSSGLTSVIVPIFTIFDFLLDKLLISVTLVVVALFNSLSIIIYAKIKF